MKERAVEEKLTENAHGRILPARYLEKGEEDRVVFIVWCLEHHQVFEV